MDKKHSKALLSDLIVLAKADEEVKDVEYQFILHLALRMHLTKEEVEDLFRNPLPSKVFYSELDRITHFYKLVLVMNIDKETHEKEITAIQNFGIKLGIRPGALNQILIRMNEFEDNIIPSEELIKIFRTYYN
jgi:uncharacterized tellurite resistance protein B-like protein